jgi:hypothetical protein
MSSIAKVRFGKLRMTQWFESLQPARKEARRTELSLKDKGNEVIYLTMLSVTQIILVLCRMIG